MTKKFITNLAKEAGDALLGNFRHQRKYGLKSKHEIVTATDLLAEKIILAKIRQKYPTHQILSEEAGLSKIKSNYLWIVDPLDGTTNFAFGNPLFAICIALAYKSQIIAGAIYLPYLKEMYFAQKNQGAFLNNKKIKVSNTNDVSSAFITYCHGSAQKYVKEALKYYRYIKLNYFDARQLGSAGVEMAFLACGRTDVYFALGTKPWDVAAGVLLVREAGGKVTNFSNQGWMLKDHDILATNGLMHEKFLKILQHAK